MRIRALISAVLALAVSAPAYAADLYSSALYSGAAGNTLYCTVLNSGTTNIKVTIRIFEIAPSSDTNTHCVIETCVVTVGPRGTVGCWHGTAFYNLAYCRVTTSNAANTEAAFSVLDGSYQTTATSIPR
jgi:hypothetical protein